MKIVKAGHERIIMDGLPCQFIERVGRTCYKSENNITKGSAEKFVKDLVARGHYAMTEHFWVHLIYIGNWEQMLRPIRSFMWGYIRNYGDEVDFFKFINVTRLPQKTFLSMPIRVVMELADSFPDDEQECNKYVVPDVRSLVNTVYKAYPEFFRKSYCFEWDKNWNNNYLISNKLTFINAMKTEAPTEGVYDREIMKHIPHTVRFICNRGVSHELVRHRPCSFAQESTRYCNYNKEKFGNEITVIDPRPIMFNTHSQYEAWKTSCEQSEESYFKLLEIGASPQEARDVLPNALKTEVVMTTNETEWQHIVNLRAKQTTGKAHPQMVEVMTPWYEELKTLSDGRIK